MQSSRNRPTSAQSRTAWGDGMDSPSRDDMVGENYDEVTVIQPHERRRDVGCCGRFFKGLRCKMHNDIIYTYI